jgi:hypothetical protein
VPLPVVDTEKVVSPLLSVENPIPNVALGMSPKLTDAETVTRLSVAPVVLDTDSVPVYVRFPTF